MSNFLNKIRISRDLHFLQQLGRRAGREPPQQKSALPVYLRCGGNGSNSKNIVQVLPMFPQRLLMFIIHR
jgi:hypothetical protein